MGNAQHGGGVYHELQRSFDRALGAGGVVVVNHVVCLELRVHDLQGLAQVLTYCFDSGARPRLPRQVRKYHVAWYLHELGISVNNNRLTINDALALVRVLKPNTLLSEFC